MSIRRKFDHMVRKSGAAERNKLIPEIKSRCGILCPTEKKRAISRGKLIALISCCAAAVCVAIITPCVLLREKYRGDGNGERYCIASDIKTQPSQYTIKQYGELYHEKILFFDWYDAPNVCQTELLILKDTNDQIGINETLINASTIESVEIQLIKKDIHIDYLDEKANACDKINTVSGTAVEWKNNVFEYSAVFEYYNYRYYITYTNPESEARFLALLTELLEEK